MTIRAQINRRFRTMSWLIYLGTALFFVDFIAGNVLNLPEWTWGFGIVGFVVAWVTMVAAWVIGFRCPTCTGRLTGLLMQRPGFQMYPKIRFCPYCGQDFDADYQKSSAVA